MKVVWGGLARVTEQARHNIVGNAIGLSFYSKKEREKERKLFFFSAADRVHTGHLGKVGDRRMHQLIQGVMYVWSQISSS